MMQLAPRRDVIKGQGLDNLGRTARKAKAREGPKAEPAVIGRLPHQHHAPAGRPQPAEGFRHQGRADPLAMPRGQDGKRADQPPAVLSPIRAAEAAR